MNKLTIDISGQKKDFQFPENFSEFTRYHLTLFAQYIRQAKEEHAYFKFLIRFFKLPKKIWLQLSASQFFWCDVKEDEIIFHPELQYLTKSYNNPKSLMQRVGIFRGPADQLKNMSLEQVAFTSTFADLFAEKADTKSLNLFFAAAYRLPFFRFRKSMIKVNLFFAKFVSEETKRAALLNYRGMLEFTRQNYPHVYKKGGKSDGTDRFAWEGTIQRLAKTGVFGSYREAKETKFPQAMILFEMNGIEVERINNERKRKKK